MSAILVAFFVSLGVFISALHGDVAFWDVGDLQTVPYILGIPYPTGFPGFVLLGWLWSHVPPGGNVAKHMNLLSAATSAGTVAALVALLLSLDTGIAIALGAAAAYALAGTIWFHATYIDVHPVGCCAAAWALVFAVRWQRGGVWGDFVRGAAGMTAALAIDNTTILFLPGVALAAAGRRPPLLGTARLAGVACLALIVVYAYLPIRSAVVTAQRVDPTLALGVAPGRPFWDDGHPSTPAGFIRVVTGSDFGASSAFLGLLSVDTFRGIGSDFAPIARREWGLVLPWLALFGVLALWVRSPFLGAGVAAFGLLPLLFAYSYGAEAEVTRYYLGIYFSTAAGGGIGARYITTWGNVWTRWVAALAMTVALGALLAVDVKHSRVLYFQQWEPDGSPWIRRVAARTPPNAVIVTPWLYATPLAYGAYVEHVLGNRIVLTANAHDFESRYRDWLRERPIIIVSEEPQKFKNFTLRELDAGAPHLYDLR